MKKPHIGFIIGNLDGHGGTERVSTMLASQFVEAGYEVTFFSPRAKGNFFFPLNKKIRVYCLGKIYDLMQTCRLWNRFYVVLRALIVWHKVDVMIDVDLGTAMFTAPAIRGTKCKEITWDHFNFTQNAKDPARQKGLRLALENSAYMVVLTKVDHQMYLEQYPNVNPNFFHQIYNPITFNVEGITIHINKRVVAVGRLTEQKGFDYLLNIWNMIESTHPDWELEIIGQGEDEQKLKQQANALGLGHVLFSPPSNDIQSKLRNASIYALSSRYEGFPMVLLESTALALPIVAFNCLTGPNEIVEEGRNGYLVPTFDEGLFAKRLSALMDDAELRNRLGNESYDISKQYTVEAIFQQWVELIEKI